MPKTIDGPYLSVKRPPKIASSPIDKNAIAVQLESIVLDHPNSSSSSLKNTPYEKSSPITVNWVILEPVTTKYRVSIFHPINFLSWFSLMGIVNIIQFGAAII
jgi:hypothetical protein